MLTPSGVKLVFSQQIQQLMLNYRGKIRQEYWKIAGGCHPLGASKMLICFRRISRIKENVNGQALVNHPAATDA